MLIIAGFVVLMVSVLGGYMLAGGALGPLWQPSEVIMIVGAAIGAFISGNNTKGIKLTGRMFGRMKHSKKYHKETYLELLSLLFKLLTTLKSGGKKKLENHIENPSDSELFAAYPHLLADPYILPFLQEYMRMLLSSKVRGHELDELMMTEIEAIEHEAHIPVSALSKVGDALPAFGIVAAVMGVVMALGAADASAAELGKMIGHALVGTFLGILLAYGFVFPVASRLEREVDESLVPLHCIRNTMVAFLQDSMPEVAIEFGRKVLHIDERPSFEELEEKVEAARSDIRSIKAA